MTSQQSKLRNAALQEYSFINFNMSSSKEKETNIDLGTSALKMIAPYSATHQEQQETLKALNSLIRICSTHPIPLSHILSYSEKILT